MAAHNSSRIPTSCISSSRPEIKTRFLVISDTHGHEMPPEYPQQTSRRRHFAIKFLKNIKAPPKLVIAGNHDFTLDTPMFRRDVTEVTLPWSQSWSLFDEPETRRSGVILDEGSHHFALPNGVSIKVYASPYTSSLGDWGFQCHPQAGHDFDIKDGVDVVITHGPPKGIMDMTDSGSRAGCPRLFEAIARSRPQMHCFGHIHEGWGAKLSKVLGKLSQVDPRVRVIETSHCTRDAGPLEKNSQTLFVNAAIEGSDGLPTQPLWLVDIELPPTVPT
ncbi:Metallo-dependent phosphatase-like protein [Aspergillus undulatus]|uniref:Metallo-dependent phosphatase-like protein n=1 Tax=Aspergillus undulatus TaxID=1810928 RepID=UPI003CCDD7DF